MILRQQNSVNSTYLTFSSTGLFIYPPFFLLKISSPRIIQKNGHPTFWAFSLSQTHYTALA